MAVIGFTGVPAPLIVPPLPPPPTQGGSALYVLSGTTLPLAQPPLARFGTTPEFGVLGSVVKLDGRLSMDPLDKPLTYHWSFLSVPIGSRVQDEGFRSLESDGDVVSFSPDVVGTYEVGLVVSNGTFESAMALGQVSISALLVPHARALVPDGKFVWSYLRDVWSQVDGKEFFETLWSALIQMVGAEMLKAYQVDFNKSIKDIQDLYQRRWLSYEPALALEQEGLSLFLGARHAGQDATSPGAAAFGDIFSVGQRPELLDMAAGRLVTVAGRAFTVQRVRQGVVEGTPATSITVSRSWVPGGLRSQPWHFPHTLVSRTQDFEALGVCPGDLLLVEVLDELSQAAAEVSCQVVGVDGRRLGFVLGTEALVPGRSPEVPEGLVSGLASRLSVPPDVAQGIQEELESGRFARSYHNRSLSLDTLFKLKGRLYRLRPKTVVRNSRLPVSEELVSVPSLRSHIVQPLMVEKDGQLFQERQGKLLPLAYVPVELQENRHYLVDSQTALDEELTFVTGTDLVETDGSDFVSRGVQPGDTFQVLEPLTLEGDYEVLEVLDERRLRLVRPLPQYVLHRAATARVRIKRGTGGTFLRFVPGTFGPRSPAPKRLWAEVSFFDNSQAIEDNFGILVALKKSQLERISSNTTYRQAVAGLMYAFTQGSSIDRIRLGAQILLGLPFSEHRGIVRSIEENYRLSPLGKPIQGRLLVEDVDTAGAPTGAMRVYTYPIDAESEELAGIETNPETGKPYRVGDTVELFRPLARGVKVDDYLTADIGTATPMVSLQRFHSVRVRINDSIFTLDELSLVSSFLRRITPAHVAYAIVSATELVDTVSISDRLSGALVSSDTLFVDSVGLSVPPALMFDSRTPGGVPQLYLEDGLWWVRRWGRDITLDGPTATLTGGGLQLPRSNEEFDGPLVEAGDVLVLERGLFKGRYRIQGVESDSQLTVEQPPGGFPELGSQPYHIARLLGPTVVEGALTAFAGEPTVTPAPQRPLRTLGVVPGDWCILEGGRRHLVRVVKEMAAGSGRFNQMELVPAPSQTGTFAYRVVRPGLLGSRMEDFEVASDGGPALTATSPFLKGLLDAGDELELQRPDKLKVLVQDPLTLWVSPPLPEGTYTVQVVKKGRADGTLQYDLLERFGIRDEVQLALVSAEESATCESGNDWVFFASYDPLAAGVRAGDALQLTSGDNSTVDVGAGPGVYPIVGVSDLGVLLSVPLSMSGTASWRIRRTR